MTELAVLIPVKDPYVTLDWAWCLRKLKLPRGTHFFFDRSHQPIHIVRENLVEEALEEVDPKWILFLDSDIIFPSETYYILRSNEYPVVSGLYPDKGNRWCVSIEKDGLPEYLRNSVNELKDKRFYVDYVGAGCLLIEAEVFKKLSKPWFKYEYNRRKNPKGLSEDFYFCKKVREELGIRILLDCRVICSHVFVGSLRSPDLITHLQL